MPGITRFKICGLSTEETVKTAIDSGAFMIGFVFFDPSPRNLTLKQAAKLAEFNRKLENPAKIVALSVDESDSRLAQIIDAVNPDSLQLHGNESPDRISDIRDRFNLPVIKSVGISSSGDLETARSYESHVDWLLFDAKPGVDSSLPGGNGMAFDWKILSDLDFSVPFLVSGGLDCSNVSEAIRITKPDAVDVSSGVESRKGVKDSKLIRNFASAVGESVSNERNSAKKFEYETV